jgi:hypothetical protein
MAVSTNISSTGLYFASATPLEVGTPIEILLRMPEEWLASRRANGFVGAVWRAYRNISPEITLAWAYSSTTTMS